MVKTMKKLLKKGKRVTSQFKKMTFLSEKNDIQQFQQNDSLWGKNAIPRSSNKTNPSPYAMNQARASESGTVARWNPLGFRCKCPLVQLM